MYFNNIEPFVIKKTLTGVILPVRSLITQKRMSTQFGSSKMGLSLPPPLPILWVGKYTKLSFSFFPTNGMAVGGLLNGHRQVGHQT